MSEYFLSRGDERARDILAQQRSANELLRDWQPRIGLKNLRHLPRPILPRGEPQAMRRDVSGKIMAMESKGDLSHARHDDDDCLLGPKLRQSKGNLRRMGWRQKTSDRRSDVKSPQQLFGGF